MLSSVPERVHVHELKSRGELGKGKKKGWPTVKGGGGSLGLLPGNLGSY